MKKLISILLACVCVFSLCSSFACAKEDDPINFDAVITDELSEKLEGEDQEWTDTGISRASFAILILYDLVEDDSSLDGRFTSGLTGKGYVCKKDNILTLLLQGDDEAICIIYLAGEASSYYLLDGYSWSKTKGLVEDLYDNDTIDKYWKLDADDTLEALEILQSALEN